MLRAVVVALVLVAVPAGWTAEGPLPWTLKERWVSSSGHNGEEWLDSFSPDGKVAYFDRRGDRLLARDLRTWQLTGQHRDKVPNQEPTRADVHVISPDGRIWAASRETEGKRGWYDLTLGKQGENEPFLAFKAAHRTQPRVRFADDGKTLISATLDALIVWDVPGLKAPRKLGPINSDPRGSVVGLVLSPDGDTLGVTCNYYKHEDQVWDLKAGKLKVSLGGHMAQVWSVAFSPDGKTIASRGNDPQIKLWEAATGLNTRSIPLEHGHRVRPVVFSRDGKLLATTDGPLVRLFDATTGKVRTTLKGHTSEVNALAFSPDGKQVVSGSGVAPQPRISRDGEPGEAIVWNLATAKAQFTFKVHPMGTSTVAWSQDGALLATGGFGLPSGKPEPVVLWDAKSGQLVRSISTEATWGITVVAFSPDGKRLLHNTDRDGTSGSRIVDVGTGKEVAYWRGAGSVMAFSPDGTKVASVGANWIGVFDPGTGKSLLSHTLKEGDATCVAWSPDGKSLATGGSDRMVRLWELVPRKKK